MLIRLAGFGSLCLVAVACIALIVAKPFHLCAVPMVNPALLRLDFAWTPLAIPFLLIIAVVAIGVATWGLKRGAEQDGFRLALFGASMVGVLLAQSVSAFALCWEVMSLVSAFLVATNHTRRPVRRAVFSYVLISQAGAFCIIAFLAILAVHARVGTFSAIASSAATLSGQERAAALLLAIVGFGSKAGLVPLQFWLPRAHPAAPANASAMLSGVMLKIAVYGLLLACFVLVAPAPWSAGIALLVVGCISALVGALYATIETEMKRLLAYSSIENVGIIVAALGLAVLAAAIHEPALAALAVVALLFHSINHATFKSLLFLSAGTLVERIHVTDLDQLGGLAHGPMRRSAPWILFACMAASALPPLNGFASEWLVFNSLIKALAVGSPLFKALAVSGIAALATTSGLGAAAFVKLYGVGFLGAQRHSRNTEPESFDASVGALALLAGACVMFGVFPMLLVRPIGAVVTTIVGAQPLALAQLTPLPVLALLPIFGAAAALVAARRRGVRVAGTWTCGSTVTLRSQYTATVFSKPIRLIFAFALFPQRARVVETGLSRWIPTRIKYVLSSRYVIDEFACIVAAFVQRFSRRTRVVQGGLMRVYLTYALVAFILALTVAR
ncbi:MAG: proton-conducting transporter transmembrane domain-containing protein [Vulcanimicrobiaceae bacterium]